MQIYLMLFIQTTLLFKIKNYYNYIDNIAEKLL